MRRKQWQGVQSGPDWTDVLTLMQALEALHGIGVAITLHPGTSGGSEMLTHITAVKYENPADVLGAPVLVLSGGWPCKEHADLVTCLFGGLYELDSQLSKILWEQKSLPFTAE